jgi:hypothetical protein
MSRLGLIVVPVAALTPTDVPGGPVVFVNVKPAAFRFTATAFAGGTSAVNVPRIINTMIAAAKIFLCNLFFTYLI